MTCAHVKSCVKLFDMRKQRKEPGAAIKALRELAHLTLKEVAKGADTSVSYLSKVENGSLYPTPKYVAKVTSFIANVLETERWAA